MVNLKEKTLFFQSQELGLSVRNKVKQDGMDLFPAPALVPHWSGVNSGVSVLTPSNETFAELVNEISIFPNRVVRDYFFKHGAHTKHRSIYLRTK
jgi:hypothetical protein